MPGLFGKTGIINTGPPWLPTNLGENLKLWLRSDLGITKDGSNRVSLLADQSGNGRDAVQSTDAKKFVWTANQLNGRPGLKSDYTDDLMIIPSFTVAQPLTVFVVAAANLDYGTNHQFFRLDANAIVFDMLSQGIRFYCGTASIASGTADYVSKVAAVSEVVLNGSNSEGFVNKVSKVAGNPGTNGINSALYVASNQAESVFFGGYLFEYIIYGSISSANRNLLYQYFTTTWGITF